MYINGLEYDDGKITSYSFTLNDQKILFDFGNTKLSLDEIRKSNFIIISHYHNDHICGLLENINELSDSCIVITTRTNACIIKELLKDHYSNGKLKVAEEKFDKIIKICYFNEPLTINGINFKFYRSGHTFGSLMALISTDKESIFFSGDMDYVEGKPERQYEILNNEIIKADFAVLDGTRIDDDINYKYDNVSKIKFDGKADMHLYCKPVKAILTAKYLLEKFPDYYIVYDNDLNQYNFIFQKYGYDTINFENRSVYTKELLEKLIKDNTLKDKPKIFLSSIHRKDEKIFSDKLISLHINANERLSFISQYFDSNTKILLGHYDPKTDISKYCENHNLDYIKKGMNFYGKQ